MKANTQQELTTTILPKLIWDAVWELDENLFSCWANTSSSLKKKPLLTKRIELMYGFGGEFLLMVLVVVWGIFQKYGFSGEQKPLNKMQTSWPLRNQMFFVEKFQCISRFVSFKSFLCHPFLSTSSQMTFFPRGWRPTFDPSG